MPQTCTYNSQTCTLCFTFFMAYCSFAMFWGNLICLWMFEYCDFNHQVLCCIWQYWYSEVAPMQKNTFCEWQNVLKITTNLLLGIVCDYMTLTNFRLQTWPPFINVFTTYYVLWLDTVVITLLLFCSYDALIMTHIINI